MSFERIHAVALIGAFVSLIVLVLYVIGTAVQYWRDRRHTKIAQQYTLPSYLEAGWSKDDPFLDPHSPEVDNPVRKRMVKALDSLLCVRLGYTAQLNYTKTLTQDEYELFQLRIDTLQGKKT